MQSGGSSYCELPPAFCAWVGAVDLDDVGLAGTLFPPDLSRFLRRGATFAAGSATAELEMALVDHAGHGSRPAVTAYPGKLASGEPGSVVPDPWLEPGVEGGEFPYEASLAVVGHHCCADGDTLKNRDRRWGHNSTAVPLIAYTWRDETWTQWYITTYATTPSPNT